MRADLWPPDRDDALRDMWAAGMTASAIAIALCTSKNAIIGRVHRLHLPGRPSPIRARATPKPVVVRAVRTLPALPSVVVVAPVRATVMPPAPVPALVPMPRLAHAACCWPVSGTGRRTVWCDQPSVRGPYCETHAMRAFLPGKAA